MKIQEETLRNFVADNGAIFDNEEDCFKYEKELAQSTVQESTKYIVGEVTIYGSGYFQKYKKKEWKNGSIQYKCAGGTGNVKYAYKFDSFEEAYNVGGNRILTLEDANKASEIGLAIEAKKVEREQRYVKVLCDDREPVEGGDYITDVGIVMWDEGLRMFGISQGETYPTFWMEKVSKYYTY